MVRRRQRREVDVGLVLGALAQAEGQALQRHAAVALARRRPRTAGGTTASRRARCAPSRSGVDRDLAPAEDGEALLGGDLLDPAAGLGHRPRRRRAGTRCRRRRSPAAAARSRTRGHVAQEARRGPASGCRRRRRSWARRPRHRGARGCAARSAPWRRCRGWPRRSGWPRRRRRRRRARARGRTALGAAGTRAWRTEAFSRRLCGAAAGGGRGRTVVAALVQGTTLARAERPRYHPGSARSRG